ncbi:MAG: MBL fold metallo-hydrolase [Bacillota bacterium]|nr:MBL fold metallo-hydrolase [Bacillota bacterium]
MNIRVFRGTHQVGGCVTEITTAKTRIFVDMGSELPGIDGEKKPETLSIDGVTNDVKAVDCNGVLFTHYHGDHTGMLPLIRKNIPMYIGEGAKAVFYLLEKRRRNGDPEVVNAMKTFQNEAKFQIGDIEITPIRTDHSAFDSYMFLIEGEGKKILHTGDFRLHGVLGDTVIKSIEHLNGEVDVVITEGTTLSRKEQEPITEEDIKKTANVLIRMYKYVFVICALTNIDRLAMFHEATPRGKYFVTDKPQKEVIETAKKYGKEYSSEYAFKKALIYGENLGVKERGFCMPVRGGKFFKETIPEYTSKYPDECLLIYSMWDGYLQQEDSPINDLFCYFKNTVKLHTTGHAAGDAIYQLCKTVKPKKAIIPIHSDSPGKIQVEEFRDKVVILEDGEIYFI